MKRSDSVSQLNTAFCRRLLSGLYGQLTPEQRVHYRAKAWTHKTLRDGWEFQWPLAGLLKEEGNFYWHGRASNAYDARYRGLREWLKTHGTPQQKQALEA